MATFDSDSGRGRQDPWSVFSSLVNREWLSSAYQYIRSFIPILLPAQAMILGGEVLMTVVSKLGIGQMNASTLGISNFLYAGAYFLVGLVVGAPLLLVGLGRMIFRLTAFCRFWLMADHTKVAQSQELKLQGVDALKQLSERKKFVGSYWFFGSLLLLLPILLSFVLLYLKFAMAGNADLFTVRSPGELVTLALLFVCLVYIVTVSALMFPVGAMQEGSPGRVALSTFGMGFKFFPQAVPIYILLALLNLIVSSPDVLFKQGLGHAVWPTDENMVFSLVMKVWQAVVALFLLPASTLPFCELWKAARREPN
jgi:hypothetical protein